MNRIIAWITPLAAGIVAASTAGAQAPKAAAQPPTTQKAAPTGGPKAGAAPRPTTPAPTPKADPAVQKAATAAELRAQGQMDVLLDEWEKQSSKVRSLQVIFERIDKLPKWGDKYFGGSAFLQSPDLACLEFKMAQVDQNGKPVYVAGPNGQKTLALEKEAAERIVCNGREVLKFMWDIHEIDRYPLDKEAREKALQQGPLPFLFNMKAAEAKQRYKMTLMAQKDPAMGEKFYLIQIVPREEIDQKSFRQAYIYLSKTTFMPDRLILYPVGDQELQDFRFTTIRPNEEIPKEIFYPTTNLKGWKVVDNADGNPNAKPAGAASAPSAARGGPTAPAVTTNPPPLRRTATQTQAPARTAPRP